MSAAVAGAVFGGVFGAVIGSYLTCVTWRIPRRMSILGRSICPACGQELQARWNVPIFGWLVLRGRARCCGARIPVRYPLIELAAAIVGAIVGAAAGIIVVFAVGVAIIVLSVLVSALTVKR